MIIDYNVENTIYKLLNRTTPYIDVFCKEIKCKFFHKLTSMDYDKQDGKASLIVELHFIREGHYTFDDVFECKVLINDLFNDAILEISAMYLAHRFTDTFFNALRDFKGGQ